MPWALNQTPPTGAATAWTFVQLAINPRSFVPEPGVFWCWACGCSSGGCGCGPGCGTPCGPCQPRPFLSDYERGFCEPCGPRLVQCDTINPYPCGSAWRAAQSGNATNYTICGLIQQSAADFAIPGSWVSLQSPPYVTSPLPSGGVLYNRGLTMQRGPDNTQWRIKYSARAGFTLGTPGPSQTPSATDEQIILGGGTDAAPTYGTFLPSDGSYRAQLCFYDEGPFIPGFYLVTYPLGNPVPNSAFLMDSLQPGSYPVDSAGISLEQDPVIIYQRTGSDTLKCASLSSEATGPIGWLDYGRTLPPVQAFVRLPAAYLGVFDASATPQVAIPVGLNQSVLADDIEIARSTYLRRAALGGTTAKKGDASSWVWNAILGATAGQLIGQQVGGCPQPLFWVSFGDVLLRWDRMTTKVLL